MKPKSLRLTGFNRRFFGRHNADPSQILLFFACEREDALVPTEDCAGEGFGGAAGSGVGNEYGIGKGSDKLVALPGQVSRGAAIRFIEGREQQQTPLLDWFAPGGGDAHTVQAASRADDEGLGALQQDIQAFFLDRRVKPADHRDAGVPKRVCEIVGADNQRAGTLLRTQEGQFLPACHLKVPERLKVLRRIPIEALL